MADDDWYRCERWGRRERTRFEQRLAAARPENRGEYLRIQGLTLADSESAKLVRAGRELLHRCIEAVGEDSHSAAGAHFELAQHAERGGDVPAALEHLEATLAFERKHGSPKHGTELALSGLIARSAELGERLDEAEALLVDLDLPPFRSAQLDFVVARARLAQRRGHDDLAAAYALGGCWLLGHDEPINGRHPDVGLIGGDVEPALLDELRALALAGDAESIEAEVEAFRGPDGTVRWEWALMEQLAGVGRGRAALRASEAAYAAALAPVLGELRGVGFEVYDFEDWTRRRLPGAAAARSAAEILTPWLHRSPNLRLQAQIAWALKDPRSRRVSAEAVIRRFDELTPKAMAAQERAAHARDPGSGEEVRRSLAWLKLSLGNVLQSVARDEHFDAIAAIIRNPEHGDDRAYAFWALRFMKASDAVDLAIEMLADDAMRHQALCALGQLKSDRAAAILERLAQEGGRDDAKTAAHGLALLRKAQAAGKSRP